ncbi:MAG TPA: O-antigen ligase family protein [Gemmatimonadales bacterium]
MRIQIPQPSVRAALVVLQVASFVIVLAAFPYPLFQLDRYTYAKELVLLLAGFGAALCCLVSARRLTVFMVDALLGTFLLVSLLSALLADNRWLSFRALGVSLAGAAVFWSARAIARAGYARPLLLAFAGAVVLGALTGLGQAYGLVNTSLASLTRAPGGTFGNRNFMAHLVAIGLPLLLLVSVDARSRRGFTLGSVGVALAAGALVLSRSRAAWLGAAVSGLFLAVEGLWVGRLWADRQLRRRVLRLTAVTVGSLALAMLLPNKLNWRSASPYLESLAGMANYREGSGAGRLIQYGNSLRMAADHPVLGVGPGNWPVHYPRYMSPGDPSFDADDIIPTNPWPSSDWFAFLSERGVPGLLMLALVGGTIGLGAWARVRRGTRHTPALTDLTIVATVLAVAVVGLFDAVLLLPAPTLFAWTIIGALASTARPVREIVLHPRTRRRLVIGVAVVGGLYLARGLGQTAAMAVFANAGGRQAQELASRLDPASYRIRMLLAQAWRAGGRCERARPHAEAAASLFPNYPAPTRLLRACGGRRAR